MVAYFISGSRKARALPTRKSTETLPLDFLVSFFSSLPKSEPQKEGEGNGPREARDASPVWRPGCPSALLWRWGNPQALPPIEALQQLGGRAPVE